MQGSVNRQAHCAPMAAVDIPLPEGAALEAAPVHGGSPPVLSPLISEVSALGLGPALLFTQLHKLVLLHGELSLRTAGLCMPLRMARHKAAGPCEWSGAVQC